MEFEKIAGLARFPADRDLPRRLHAQRGKAMAAQRFFATEPLNVDRHQLGAQRTSLDAYVIARADYGESSEPQPVDALAGEGTKILRHALGISECAALQHADDFVAPCEQAIDTFQLGRELRARLARAHLLREAGNVGLRLRQAA